MGVLGVLRGALARFHGPGGAPAPSPYDPPAPKPGKAAAPVPKPTPRPRGGLFGRLSGAFGACYPTLQFFGHDGTWEIVQLRKLTGSLVLIRIRGQIYPVYLDSTKAKTYRYGGVPMAQTFLYSLDDMFPFDPSQWSNIDKARKKAKYTRLTPELAQLVVAAKTYLDQTHAPYVTVSDLCRSMYSKEVAEGEIARFTATSGTTKIARPTPDLYDFCANRLLADPGMLTAAITGFEGMDREWRLIANPARGPFRHWALVGILMLGLAAVGVTIVGATEGWFGEIGSAGSLEAVFEAAKQYATPEAAQLAGDTTDAVSDLIESLPVPDVSVSSATGAAP